MVTIDECTRKNFCVDCDDSDCTFAGCIEADCPKWKCDNQTMDCENCEFLKEYKKGGDGMNHDYAHCVDFKDDCPKECFRAQLARDLENVPIWYPVSWMHLKGMEECKKEEVTE